MNEDYPVKRIAVLSSGRADYGLLYWTLNALHEAPDMELQLIVAAMHLSPLHGHTVEQVEADPWQIASRIDCLLASDTGASAARAIGLATIQVAGELERLKPDWLLVLGDRFELLAAVNAALLMRIPIAHLHGGEVTFGAVDEQVRHSVTQMASLHLPATEAYGRNILAMGEEPWRVRVVGAPGLEWLRRAELPSRDRLELELDIDLARPWLMVTYHPATLSDISPAQQVQLVLDAVAESGLPAMFSLPNADPGGLAIRHIIDRFVAAAPQDRRLLSGLGQRRYLGLLRHLAAIVGNSSSGIIEAPSFGLPTVNIGPRQAGRVRATSVLDVDLEGTEIRGAIERALSPEFRQGFEGLENPYGQGDTSRLILEAFRSVSKIRSIDVKRRTFWNPGR